MDNQVQKALDVGLENFTNKYELPEAIVEDLRAILVNAFKAHVKPRPAGTAGAAKGEKRQRLKTGYNLFIKAKFEDAGKQCKTDDDSKGPNSQDQMASFSKLWKTLSEEEKRPYMDLADAINAENGVGAAKKGARSGKRNLSGYNLFYREERANIRESKDKDVGLMVAVGAAWRALSKEQQDAYNKQAAEESASVLDGDDE